MTSSSSLQPLAGIRVLDLSRVLAGPMCAMALADFGADVIKVEHPARGDDTRDWGVRVGTRNTSYFNSANRNKRSITLDLQSEAGLQVARAIAVSSEQAKLLLPGVKSVAEQGFPGFDADTWGGLIAPLGTPQAVVDRLNQELKVALADPALQKKMLAAGAIVRYQDGATMKARLAHDYARWSKIASDKGISAQ
ncbi:tripartite tricarboxylate transporter substrate-binding protein [Comamonas jiangduensis]|uniref:tripartite tricarboxylate transporter substrate-binding protein n=1 Tax=Comamonas jiangduensis TaxID=1194168 RepID=UPI0028AFCC48|nr:tripartite tricarboxylate transporter substrate-binding protein [Comamonas jiangduensis]